jgi:hypothetical protein
MLPTWVYIVIAIAVVIIIVVIVVVLTSPTSKVYRIKSVYTETSSLGAQYLNLKDNQLVVSTTGMRVLLTPTSIFGTNYFIKSADDTSQVLTYNGTANGAVLSLAANINKNQSWAIQVYQSSEMDTDTNIFRLGQLLNLSPTTDTTKSMDLTIPVQTSDSPVSLWNSHPEYTNQQWVLIPE